MYYNEPGIGVDSPLRLFLLSPKFQGETVLYFATTLPLSSPCHFSVLSVFDSDEFSLESSPRSKSHSAFVKNFLRKVF